jgi:hypothetical protein
VYVAADRHGNVNPRVVDVFRSAATYRNHGKENLQVIGKMGKVPSTREGLQEALSKFGTPPSASLGSGLRGIGSSGGGIGGGGGQNVTLNAPITINATSAQPEAIASRVRSAVQISSKDFLAAAKRARADELRLGWV